MTGSLPTEYLYVLSGLAVGMLVGMTGVGGGSLMTPLLVLLFGFHPATAVGTDLLFAAGTKTVGTAMHGWRNTIDWRVVRRLATGSVPGAAVTLVMLSAFGVQSKSATHIITVVLGFALLLTAVSLVFRPQIMKFASQRLREPPEGRVALLTVVDGPASPLSLRAPHTKSARARRRQTSPRRLRKGAKKRRAPRRSPR